jgi:hypothetical protein
MADAIETTKHKHRIVKQGGRGEGSGRHQLKRWYGPKRKRGWLIELAGTKYGGTVAATDDKNIIVANDDAGRAVAAPRQVSG